MKKITLLLACFGFAGTYAQTNCANALTVGTGQHGVTYANGSEIPSVNCFTPTTNGTPKAAWYKYTPTEDFSTTISSYIVGGTNYDTYLQVFEGSCGSLVCVGADDNSGPNLTSILTFMAEAGTTYYIVFENRYNSSNFTFSLTQNPPPMFSPSPVGMASMAVVDMNGDYLDDLATPGNNFVNILLQSANGSGFTSANRTAPTITHGADWSIAAGDYNKDGYNDLLFGDTFGSSLLLTNSDGTAFTTLIETPQTVFTQRTNFVDINEDGNLDAFICHDVQPNVYFINDGAGGYEFIQGGLGDYPSGGNYGSIWIDYNNDNHIDLFIAKCRGGSDPAGINELHMNNGNGNFTQIAGAGEQFADNIMSDIIQTWSSAWADYDNDGDMDALVGISSNQQGGHKLMVNNGDGTFTNETANSGYDVFTATSVEHVAHDFNNDGWVDVLGGSQTIMMNNGDMTFTPYMASVSSGPIGDLNNDGFLDILNNSTIYFNNGNENNWVKVTLEGIESNSNGIGARVEVYAEGDGWEKQIRDIRSGDGFEYMSSLNAHFGLGTTEEIEKIVVKWPSGTVDTILNPDINGTVHFREGDNALSTPQVSANNPFTIYPNPVQDMLTISGKENITAIQVYDMAGRLVKSLDVVNNQVSLQSLAKGTYIVKIKDAAGAAHSSKIVKE